MKNIMWPLFVASIFLSGCASIESSETLDQLGHFGAGKLIACDASRWVSPQEAVDHTMAFARAREELQHPGQCNEGCQRDLEAWQRGAEKGSTCKLTNPQ